MLPSFPRLFLQLVKILSVFSKPTYRGIHVFGYLDEVQSVFPGEPESLLDGDDPDLLSLFVNNPDLRAPYLVVYEYSLLQIICVEVGRMSSRPEKFGTAVFKRIPIDDCKEGGNWAKPFF